MCKFMLKVGRQCKLAPKSDYCSKHKKYAPDSESSEVNTITTPAYQSIESSTITDTTMCQHQVNAPIESTQEPVPTSQLDLFDMIFDMKTGGPRVKELKVIEGSFCEHFDRNKLAFIILNQSEIEKLFREEARNDLPLDKYYFASSNGLCPVSYNQNKGFHGRYYAHGSVSAQNMVREVRHTIFDDFYVDMDIDNAHPVFTVWLCGKLGIPCYVMASYVANRDTYMQELMDANGLTRGQAKMVYLSINFGGSSKYKDVKNKTQHLIDYFKESKSIQKSIAEKLPYFAKLTQAKREASGKSYNIEGSCLSQVCGFIENQILARMVEYLDTQIGYNVVRDSVLCFDGIMIPKDHFDSRFLPELETIFSSMGVPLKLSMKKFEPLDLSLFGYNPEQAYKVTERGNSPRSLSFEQTFRSKLINDSLSLLLKHMGRSWNEFKDAMNDDSFSPSELSFWVEKHCSIRNCASNDFELSYAYFEGLLKQIVFRGDMHFRFVCYFIHEFLVFGMQSSSCWVRAKVTKYNNVPLKPYQMSELKNAVVQYETGNGKRVIESKIELFNLLKSIPYRKFSNLCHVWNHDPLDSETFSTALPFQYTDLGRVVQESDLPDLLMHYLKDVLCDGDEESWIWLRSYLANVIHQPDKRTEVMLVLYSQKKRLGKSTLKHIVDLILGEDSNVAKVDRLSDVFGERGGTTVANKRVVWFEELTDNKNVFRANMDRMKTSITDKRVTYKPLYQELIETNNTNEYIACTNHLVGVLEDRQTFLHVSDQHANDHAFYSALRANMDQHGCNLFATYLKPYTTQMPMKCHKTSIYKSMLSNASESIETYIKELKSGHRGIEPIAEESFSYLTQEVLYTTDYLGWCKTNNEKQITLTHFKEKLHHYDHSCEYKRCRIKEGGKSVRIYAFCFPIDWITPEPADVEA